MKFEPKQWWSTFREFIGEVRAEMKKVAWPARQEVLATTGVVVVAVIVMGLYLWGLDVAFYRAVNAVFGAFGAAA